MSKTAFIQILESAKILKLPKVEEVKKTAVNSKGKDAKKNQEEKQQEENKQVTNEVLFTQEDVMHAIQPVHSFDSDHLDYYNFLEALWRLSLRYPFSKEVA